MNKKNITTKTTMMTTLARRRKRVREATSKKKNHELGLVNGLGHACKPFLFVGHARREVHECSAHCHKLTFGLTYDVAAAAEEEDDEEGNRPSQLFLPVDC